MSESRYYPCTQPTGPGGTPVVVNGGEVQTSDLILLGQVAGQADDRALAELLRVAPLASAFAAPTRLILPYDVATPTVAGTVIPSGSADASVLVQPFRMIVGPRVTNLTDPAAWWKDARSAAFTIENTKLTLTPNSSGSTLWDLVYAQLTLDTPGNARTRRIKDPNQGNVTVQQIFQTLETTVTVGVMAGTVADTVPDLPQDSVGSIYYAPLAAIRKATGFSGTHAVATTDIRDLAPCAALARSTGATTVRPATGANSGLPTGTSSAFSWSGSGVTRPTVFLPPSMVGGEQLLFELDVSNGSAPSHPNGTVLDDSCDWRNRLFLVHAMISTDSYKFANDPSATGTCLPFGQYRYASASNTQSPDFVMANSFRADATLVASTATIYLAGNAQFPNIIASGVLGVYVDMGTGALTAYLSATPPNNVRVLLWLQATAQFSNV